MQEESREVNIGGNNSLEQVSKPGELGQTKKVCSFFSYNNKESIKPKIFYKWYRI